MSEILEKMCIARVGGKDRWADHSEVWRMVERDRMREALAILADPINITDEMTEAASQAIDKYYDGTKDAPFEGSVRAAISSALASIVK